MNYRCIVGACVFVIFFSLADNGLLARPMMQKQSPADRFSVMDADQDGRVSREEFFLAQRQMREEAFQAIDADRDGFISFSEWEEFLTTHGKTEPSARSDEGGEQLDKQEQPSQSPRRNLLVPERVRKK